MLEEDECPAHQSKVPKCVAHGVDLFAQHEMQWRDSRGLLTCRVPAGYTLTQSASWQGRWLDEADTTDCPVCETSDDTAGMSGAVCSLWTPRSAMTFGLSVLAVELGWDRDKAAATHWPSSTGRSACPGSLSWRTASASHS